MITVVGSINLDLIAHVPRLPNPGETVTDGTFQSAPGGKGANQALAAKRAGAQVRMVGAVGSDAFAEQALQILRRDEVDLTKIKETHVSTGTALIMVGENGENMISVAPGANSLVAEHYVDSVNFREGDCALVQLEIPVLAAAEALSRARAGHAISILNCAPVKGEAAHLLEQADFVVANETEFDLYAKALSLDGKDRKARMKNFAKANRNTIIVTLGKDGVLAATPNEFIKVPVHKVDPVDTVGAGDTFCGYLAASLISGLSLKDSLRRAAVAGALACLKHGAQPAIPMAREVERAL